MTDYEIAPDVRPGGILNIYDVRILICYLLHQIQKPMSKDQLTAVFRSEKMVQYFTFSDALSQLVSDHHLKVVLQELEEYYELTDIGHQTARTLQDTLPAAAREHLLQAARETLSQWRIQKENRTVLIPLEQGYSVQCKFSDGDHMLFEFSMYAPSLELAERIQQNFLKDPSAFYSAVLQYLTADS